MAVALLDIIATLKRQHLLENNVALVLLVKYNLSAIEGQ